MPGRTYSDDEVEEILRRAVEQSAQGGARDGLTREELIDAARDAGIDTAAVQDAIGAIERDRELQGEIVALRKGERKSLTSSFLTWAIITVGLLAMRFFGDGGWWFVWPMGIWAVFLLLRLKGVLFESPEQTRERAERQLEHRRRQQKRHGRHVDHRRKIPTSPAVERGVEELLDAAARRSGRASARVRAPDASDPIEASESDRAADVSAAEAMAEPKVRGRSRS